MPIRLDYRLIEKYIEPGSRVLDLGCGTGELLEELIREKDVDGTGIDIDREAAQECVQRGVPLYHGDMLEGMSMFSDNSFDCVVLSQTLQQAMKPAKVVREMMRVGKKAVISFPNYGYWRVRLNLLFRGRKPVTPLLNHPWHSTPNIHMLTIKDFLHFCRTSGYEVSDAIYLTEKYNTVPGFLANWFASMAIFVLKNDTARD